MGLFILLYIIGMLFIWAFHMVSYSANCSLADNVIKLLKDKKDEEPEGDSQHGEGNKKNHAEGTVRGDAKRIVEEFKTMIEKGFVKSISDCENLREWLYEKLFVEIPAENYVLAGLLGTFGGLLFSFLNVTRSGAGTEQLLNQLFSGSGIAFVTSIVGIFFYAVLLQRNNSLVRRINEVYLLMSDYIIKNVTPSVKESLRSEIRKIGELLKQIKDLPEVLGPVTERLGGVVDKFETVSGAMEGLYNESIKTQRELKTSLETMNAQYESILNRMNDDIIGKETLLDGIKKISESMDFSANILQEITLMYKDFKSKMKDMVDKLEEKLGELNEKFSSAGLEEELHKIREGISELKVSTEQGVRNMEGLPVSEIKDNTGKLLEIINRIDSGFTTLWNNLGRLDEILNTLNSINGKIDGGDGKVLENKLDEIVGALEEMKENFPGKVDSIGEGKMSSELDKIQEMLERIIKEGIPVSLFRRRGGRR